MTNSTTRARLLASSMITSVALVAASAGGVMAQAAPAAAAAPAAPVEEFVVTGSRIPQANLTSVSPVTTVNSQAIKLQGATNVEDFINNLPQAFADFGQYESNGASGTSTIDLRGLGNTRTLVLIDGKRLQPGDPLTPVADLNFIPPALIDRVEVLTGGASAVYGSDAVAGVVNFIMKHNFEGLQVDGETTIAEHGNNNQQTRNAVKTSVSFGFPALKLPSGSIWDGQRHTVTIIGGANSADGKGNVEFYLGYTSIDPVNEAQRDFSLCSLTTNTSNTTQQYCSGSSTAVPGRFTPEGGPNKGHSFNLTTTADPGSPVGNLPPFTAGDRFNFAPYNYFQRPDTRYTAGEFSHYEINKAIDLYSSFMFMDDHTAAAIAPSGSFFGDQIYNIPCADPLLSVAQATTLCGPGPYTAGQIGTAAIGRRNVEGGPRVADIEHMDYRIVFGSKGDLGDGWTYDVSAQYGRSLATTVNSGYFLNSKLLKALNVVTDPGTGMPACQSFVDGTDPTCVPYNIFSPGGVTKAAIDYLSGTAIGTGATTEQVVTGSISGDLGHYGMKSPFAQDGVGVSVGAEYRREFIETQFDATTQSGDLAGSGGSSKDTQGAQADKDVFAELRVPLIQDVPFVKDLTFEGGYRYSNYTSGGGNNTYKLGLDWQIVPDLRLRGTYERAVRAPNVQELFDPSTPGLVAGSDPCAGATPSFTAAQCFNTLQHSAPGITLAQFTATIYGNIPQCISGQCGDIAGGNPNLVPEVATTKSVGFVFTPTFLRGFSVTADYFDIVVDKAVVTLPLTLILNGCALDNLATSCSLINRNPALTYALYGGLGAGSVNTALVNAGSLATRGVDVNVVYRFSLADLRLPDYGSLALNFDGTYVSKLTTSLPGQPTYDCAGLYGPTCGTPTPKYRSQLRVSWISPWNLTLSANWRYLSSTSLDFNTSQPALQSGGNKDHNVSDARIPDYSFFDLSFSYKLRDRYTIRGGVNNVFDRTPPVLDSNNYAISAPAFGNGNTYPQVFDPLGRVFFLGLTADF